MHLHTLSSVNGLERNAELRVVPATGASSTPPGSLPRCSHRPPRTLTEAAAAERFRDYKGLGV